MNNPINCKHVCIDCRKPIPLPNPADANTAGVNLQVYWRLHYHHRMRCDGCAKGVALEAKRVRLAEA